MPKRFKTGKSPQQRAGLLRGWHGQGHRKLDPTIAAAIRMRYCTTLVTQDELAVEYKISTNMISRIVNGKAWNCDEYDHENKPPSDYTGVD